MSKNNVQSVLASLPCCPIWAIERHLREAGLVHHGMNGRDGAELAMVAPGTTEDGVGRGLWREQPVRGVATLDAAGVFTFELGSASDQSRIYSAALKRLNWKGCEFTSDVLGGAS